MNLLNLFRKKRKPEDKLYPQKYMVRVCVDHPRIIGHVAQFNVCIDANNKAHASRQLRKELKFFISGAIRIKS